MCINLHFRLSKPLNRALYLLEMKGKPLEEKGMLPGIDATFLAEIMETNEEVDEAESPEDLVGIKQHNKMILDEYIEDISKAFKAEDVDKARLLVAKMKYYSNIHDKITKREFEYMKVP